MQHIQHPIVKNIRGASRTHSIQHIIKYKSSNSPLLFILSNCLLVIVKQFGTAKYNTMKILIKKSTNIILSQF